MLQDHINIFFFFVIVGIRNDNVVVIFESHSKHTKYKCVDMPGN